LNSTGAASNLSTIGTALGTAGGAETHTLTEAQLPAHRHFLAADDFGSGNLFITGPTNSNQVRKGYDADGFSTVNDQDYTLSGTSTEATLGRSSSVGSGSVHNNVQPTIILNYMIKT
jgi:microcystin-dependent protein